MPDIEAILKRLGGRTLNEAMVDESIRHAIVLESLKKGQVQRIGRFVNNDLLPSLEAKLLRAGSLTPAQASRLAQTVQSMRSLSAAAAGKAGEQFTADMRALGNMEADWQRLTMQANTPLNFTFKQPSIALLNQATLKTGVQGKLLEDWFRDIGKSAADAAEGVLRRGVATGQTVNEMVTALRGTKANGFKDGAIQATRRQAATVVRTSVNHVANQAHEAVFKANKDVITGVQWVSVLDRRTTDICISLDGMTWPVGQGQRPPAHHQCRSITVPVMADWKKFGVNPDSVPEASRKAMGGEVPAKVTYPEWLAKQSKEFQNTVLGPSRAELFRNGTPVTTFVDKNLRPRSLGAIRQSIAAQEKALREAPAKEAAKARREAKQAAAKAERAKVITEVQQVMRRHMLEGGSPVELLDTNSALARDIFNILSRNNLAKGNLSFGNPLTNKVGSTFVREFREAIGFTGQHRNRNDITRLLRNFGQDEMTRLAAIERERWKGVLVEYGTPDAQLVAQLRSIPQPVVDLMRQNRYTAHLGDGQIVLPRLDDLLDLLDKPISNRVNAGGWNDALGAHRPGVPTGIPGVIADNGRVFGTFHHEVGHAIDAIVDLQDAAPGWWRKAHTQVWEKLNPYIRQSAPGDLAGISELIADSFGDFVRLTKQDFVRKYSDEIHEGWTRIVQAIGNGPDAVKRMKDAGSAFLPPIPV